MHVCLLPEHIAFSLHIIEISLEQQCLVTGGLDIALTIHQLTLSELVDDQLIFLLVLLSLLQELIQRFDLGSGVFIHLLELRDLLLIVSSFVLEFELSLLVIHVPAVVLGQLAFEQRHLTDLTTDVVLQGEFHGVEVCTESLVLKDEHALLLIRSV